MILRGRRGRRWVGMLGLRVFEVGEGEEMSGHILVVFSSAAISGSAFLGNAKLETLTKQAECF
jgi:hypothetical protein